MSSESILEYPALFNGPEIVDMDTLILEYLENCKKYPGETNISGIKAHVHKFMHSGFNAQGHTDLRAILTNVKPNVKNTNAGLSDVLTDTINQLVEISKDMQERRKNVPVIDKISWYYRHWGKDAIGGVKNKDQYIEAHITNSPWNDWMCDDPRNPQSQAAKDQREDEKRAAKEQRKL